MSRIYEMLVEARKHDILDTAPTASAHAAAECVPSKSVYDANIHGIEKEELTKLARALVSLSEPAHARGVVFSGLEQGSGCTWVIARTARVLASLVAESVCVVDANLRSPSLHKEFGLNNGYGLADAMLRSGPAREFAQRISGGNLWVMTSGCCSTSQDGARVTFDTIYSRVSDLRREFDYLIIDSPPLNTFSDALVLGRNSNGVVLVLKANVSRHDTARKVLQDLEAARVRLLGTVLNQRTFPLPGALYNRL
jgi:Mrp family chromosome partitioning ATPase